MYGRSFTKANSMGRASNLNKYCWCFCITVFILIFNIIVSRLGSALHFPRTIHYLFRKLRDNQTETDMVRHIDSLLITLSKEAIDCYSRNGYFTEQDILLNEHTPLLIDAGLLEEKFQSSEKQSETPIYEFFDPLLHEYTCALFYAETIIDRPEEAAAIVNILFSIKWRNICVLVAGLLGKRFNVVVEKLNLEQADEQTLLVLADCLHQCQCPNIAMRNVKPVELPSTMDLSEYRTTSSTFKGIAINPIQ